MNSVKSNFKKCGNYFWSVKYLKTRIPILNWLPKYKLEYLIQDFIAGISVGLLAIPQSIANANIANLQPQYGLYSSFMAGFVYFLFGPSKDLTIGPTSVLALMMQKYVVAYGSDIVILLTFLSGCCILLLGIFHLGFLIDFISMPVISAFRMSAIITLAFTQIQSGMGLSGDGDTFLQSIIHLIKNFDSVNLWDSVLGISTLIIIILMRILYIYGSKTRDDDVPLWKNILLKCMWFIGIFRNAIVLVLGCLCAYIFEIYDMKPFSLIAADENIKPGLPPFNHPPFSTTFNGTSYGFLDMVEILNTDILIIALLATLEAVAIAKVFSREKIVDSTQEMCALGLCNIMGSFVRSMPTTGSFMRTAINNVSGVCTPLGGVFTGLLVLLVLGTMTSALSYIPKAVLSGINLGVLISMMRLGFLQIVWRSKKLEVIPFMGTVVISLTVSLQLGIVVGVSLNIILILATVARPSVKADLIKVNGQDVLLVIPSDSLLYCSADHFYKTVYDVALAEDQEDNTSIIVVVDGSRLWNIDITVAKSIKVLMKALEYRHQMIFLWKFNSRVRNVLIGVYSDAANQFVNQTKIEDLVKSASFEESTMF